MIAIDASAGSWLAAQMRLWRERALLTQEQLAHCTGLGVRTIRRLESQVDLRPRSESIRLLAAALNLSDDELAQLVSASNGKPSGWIGHQSRRGADDTAVARQLPRDVSGFTGRTEQLALLERLRPGSLVVICGTAGVGKTSLAVHWAHRAAARFPDGQLYVNLRGFDSSGVPVEPSAAIRGFLTALGVSPRRVPPDVQAQEALFRSIMTGRRMLLLLDNAGSACQVRPLLPAAGATLVVVTSRHMLAGLAATDNAELVSLPLLGAAEARRLLARRIGARRANAEPEAVREITACCAGLPIALAVAAARATSEPELSLAALADRLRDSSQRLSALDLADEATDIRAVFSWSYRRLGRDAARLFRLLSLHPGAEVTFAAAASLAGLPRAQTVGLLAELAAAHLIGELAPGRFVLHDLLRLFAREQVTPPEADEAIDQLADHCLHSALAASRALYPAGEVLDAGAAGAATTVPAFADGDEALRWFVAEHKMLLAMVRELASRGCHRRCWELAWALTAFLERQGYWHECLQVQQLARSAADQLGDPRLLALATRALGRTHLRAAEHDLAQQLFGSALALAQRAGASTVQAQLHLDLSMLLQARGDIDAADRHSKLALSVYRSLGDATGVATALNFLGWQRNLAGDHAAAIVLSGQALKIFERLGRWSGAHAATLHSLGYAHHELGRYQRADSLYRQALALLRDRGDRFLLTRILIHSGETLCAMGNGAEARARWGEALAILERLDHPDAAQLRERLGRAQPAPATVRD